jgi:hypothetical protein
VRRLLGRLQLGIVLAFALLLALMVIVGALIGGAFDAGNGGTAVAPGSGTPSGGGGGFPAGSGHHQGGSQTGLNRALLKCLRGQGVEITSPNDIYAAPPQALQACGHHSGGGVP